MKRTRIVVVLIFVVLILPLAFPALATVVESGEVYVVPRGGSWLLGSTVERIDFEKRVTAGTVARLIAAAARLLPAIEAAAFRRAWSGLRPGTPDGLPVLGRGPLPGLYLATGHFRNGILLTPVTADLIAAALAGEPAPDWAAAVDPRRFSGVAA